ncbi:uncharacterized protein LOC141915308 [Tubulanus polymorphus]|uniref:uncharacterized protein LOC141915308 n=1 Tax=Tubulanus polymorphus TaxID=672921 RepID=UPI003DA22CAB
MESASSAISVGLLCFSILFWLNISSTSAAAVAKSTTQANEPNTKPEGSKFYCTFENGDCGWTSNPPGAWTVKHTGRETYIREHTYNKDMEGHMVVLSKINEAQFISPLLNFTSKNRCLRFWTRYYFQLSQSQKPTLRVLLQDTKGVKTELLKKELTINPPSPPYQLIEHTITQQTADGFKILIQMDWTATNSGWMFLDDTVIYFNDCKNAQLPKCFNPTQFRCTKSAQCLDPGLRCNGYNDCSNDLSDEENCPDEQQKTIIIMGVCIGVGVPLVILTIVLLIVYCRWEKNRKEASRRLMEKERESNFNSLDRKRLSNRYNKKNPNALLNTSTASSAPSTTGSLIDDHKKYDDTNKMDNGQRTSTISASTVV